MKLNRILGILVCIILMMVVTVACNKNQPTSSPVDNQVTTDEHTAAVQQTTESTSEPKGPPDDVPIMPDAYELRVVDALNLTYKVDATIEDVVAFYQTELPNNGWDQINNPDSVVGSMAQMARSKTNGDRITFSFQYNQIGEFTLLRIFITRAP